MKLKLITLTVRHACAVICMEWAVKRGALTAS